jgi:hypothetical protein
MIANFQILANPNLGGEALVFSEKFGDRELAVRLQIFDSFLFTKKFSANQIKWKTHLISGKNYYFCRFKSFKISKVRQNTVLNSKMTLLLYRFTKMLLEITRISNYSMSMTKMIKTVSAGSL